ncbi:MAG: M23 family metallopeptidase [Cyanobacteriota bacterium]
MKHLLLTGLISILLLLPTPLKAHHHIEGFDITERIMSQSSKNPDSDKSNHSQADLHDEPITESFIEVSIDKPEHFTQGNSFIVNIKSKKELTNPKIQFAGKETKLYKISDGYYRGIAGVDAETKPGGYTINATDDSNNLNFSEVIEVIAGNFPIQNISISGSKASLTATEDELNKVQAAKDAISEKGYWAVKPFITPVSGCMISPYGRKRYHNGKPTGDYHKGIDIKAPLGRPIYTTEAGKVLIAEDFRLHGKTVAIDHGQGLMSIYIHMNKIDVKKGDELKRGQQIGTVGSTGFATGPHLHWGMYVNSIPVNPNQWIVPVKSCK